MTDNQNFGDREEDKNSLEGCLLKFMIFGLISLVLMVVGCPIVMSYVLRKGTVVSTTEVTPGHVSHFFVEMPKESSDHYYFRSGFGDIDEYWSFTMSKDKIVPFLEQAVREGMLQPAEAQTKIPEWYNGPGGPNAKEWKSENWFKSQSELEGIYCSEFHFYGYDLDTGRVYLFNYN